MGITHVLRGEDLLSSTPRQLALYEALAAIGVGDGTTPRFGHLPYVMGEGNKKLSKRDPQSSLNLYREEGYLPEGLLNYLALLGWSTGDDREFFSPTRWRCCSTSAGCSPTRRASTPRSASRSTATGSATSAPRTSPRGSCPTWPPWEPSHGSADRRAAGRHRRRRAAGPGAHGDAAGRRRAAALPARAGGRVPRRSRRTASACSPSTPVPRSRPRTTRSRTLEPFAHAAIEAALRAALVEGSGSSRSWRSARCGSRSPAPHLAAAVRVARAARSRPLPRTPRRGPAGARCVAVTPVGRGLGGGRGCGYDSRRCRPRDGRLPWGMG